jgi:perosamine synthetase
MKNVRAGMSEFPLMAETEGIVLFYPHIPKDALGQITDTLSSRWIGQGPKVEKFEELFKARFLGGFGSVAVGSGTDALHLAYLLADIKRGDEVLVPVFTCTATNIPLLYLGAKPIFVDIDPLTFNLSIDDLLSKITKKTKAIVCVDYGGIPNNYDQLNTICKEYGLKLIADAAHSLGSSFGGVPVGQLADFTMFSFQAIKTLTTGDGGLLSIKDPNVLSLARRLRWFGINREEKQKGIWENDLVDIGYKYQMTDLSAALGLAGLEEIDFVISKRRKLFETYCIQMVNPRVRIVGKDVPYDCFNCPWLLTVIVDKDRAGLMERLRENKVESAQVHYRNDRYSIFGGRDPSVPNMDNLEDRYIVLPLHTKMNIQDVHYICDLVNSGW